MDVKFERFDWGIGWMSGVQFPVGAMMACFLFATASRPDLEPTQPPFRWVMDVLTPEVQRPGREADHSPSISAQVKNAWSYTSTPPRSLRDLVLG
jgi:hypothetical protein